MRNEQIIYRLIFLWEISLTCIIQGHFSKKNFTYIGCTLNAISAETMIIPTKINPIGCSSLNKYHPVASTNPFQRGFESKEAAENFLNPRLDIQIRFSIYWAMKEAVDRINWGISMRKKLLFMETMMQTEWLPLHCLRMHSEEWVRPLSVTSRIASKKAMDWTEKQSKPWIRGWHWISDYVDLRIRSPEEVEHAGNLGMDMIISDHHQPGVELPEALAIINPRRRRWLLPLQRTSWSWSCI